MVAITFPINTSPGNRVQDGAGRLINAFPEIRQNGQGMVWRRVPGTVTFTNTYPATVSFTGTATVTFRGTNRQGAFSADGIQGTATFVGAHTP